MFTTHISRVRDGAIIQFPHSTLFWMKTCNAHDGTGGVCCLKNGRFIPVNCLDGYGYGTRVIIVAKNLDDFINNDTEE